ncbi:OPT/YSL family transporter [Pseudonocardia acaciae]|uniref:OPT/YSL family transporter n=1 Tax=Pseudonocardia acaciae TaxID=551276 RepID=UPI0009FE3C95|nr:OPT/YSL family transporter [Pseudonocardia acaciae]
MVSPEPIARLTGDEDRHPGAFGPVTLVLTIALSVLGAIIGLHLVTTLGITANTSVIGALVAMLVGRVSVLGLRAMRSVHRQNLVQSAISASTFAAANALLTPIAVPFVFGRPDLVWPMLVGAVAGLAVDAWVLFRIFDSRFMPATAAWPPGVAAAETIIAGDRGGRRAVILACGGVVGFGGSWLGLSMSAAGVAFIGNMWALGMFGLGLLIAQYEPGLLGVNLNAQYIPHGVMIGAGVVALVQAVLMLARRRARRAAGTQQDAADPSLEPTVDEARVRRSLAGGYLLFVAGALVLGLVGGVSEDLSAPALVGWVLLAGFAALVHEIIVGLAAMHAGWFPAFAVTLIFLVVGLLVGIPPLPLALLVGYCAATGPAFADMGYDFKAGWLLRRAHRPYLPFELAGRRQQFLSAVIGCAVAVVVVAVLWQTYFRGGQLPPVAKVYAATVKAGLANPDHVVNLALWAIPGALVQLLGGPSRQMGILLATGLLVATPNAGWLVFAALIVRVVYGRIRGGPAENELSLVGAGIIAGDSIAATANVVKK